MSKLKRVLIWFILVVLFAAGGYAIWFKLQVDKQPEHHEEPEIPELNVPLPDPDEDE